MRVSPDEGCERDKTGVRASSVSSLSSDQFTLHLGVISSAGVWRSAQEVGAAVFVGLQAAPVEGICVGCTNPRNDCQGTGINAICDQSLGSYVKAASLES